MFINDLPNGKDTVRFATADASGSTSQAANVIEGMEAGVKLLLIDEDTSATNFMIRDELSQIIETDGLVAICESRSSISAMARPRRQEIFACFNRYRGLVL